MSRQFRLVLCLCLAFALASASTPQPSKHLIHDIVSENLVDSPEEVSDEDLTGKSGIKISTPKITSTSSNNIKKSTTTTTSTAKPTTTSTEKPTTYNMISPEILSDLIEASKHNSKVANDPIFNKYLAQMNATQQGKNATDINHNSNNSNNNKIDVATNKKESTENDDDDDNYDDYNYDDDYNYNDASTTTTESSKKVKSKSAVSTATTAKPVNQKLEMKPINNAEKHKVDKKENNEYNDIDYSSDEDDDDSDEDDDDDLADDDDLSDNEEVIFSENVPCPRYCVCARNVNAYLVATCSRLDAGTQKFGSDITDLIVTDVGPKYPILLGPEFFAQLGLKQVSSIKIANSTIEYLHPAAFHGLDELYSVNLTNVGLAIISPDTFCKNKKLRMLTISGNDLSVMSSVHYLLNSTSIEELDLSRNNLMELNPKAFTKLTNIVYINLSQNNLQQIPEHVFDFVDTIEELDLSYNSLKSLPANIFNRTSIAILHLKYNSFTGNLNFGTHDLQQLDLSFNSINQVHHGMFDKMSGLTNLNLKGNGITKIQSDSFINLKNLRHIDLSINEFDQLSSMVFYKNTDLDVIRLSDNPKLSQLPTDGFLNVNGYFTVYYLDISNCAVGALGHKTFSTMPHLATLKLAWNNINNLERDTFNSLSKLIDLDLSNNLISKLDDMIFMNNNELTKLNLAGNPIRKLSVRLFMPMSKLRELDVSDCELSTLLSDVNYGVGKKYKFYETLRSFNASANQIKRISSQDVKYFKNLRTLDISNNPLRCNEDFQDFIAYVSLNSNMSPRKVATLANLETDAAIEVLQQHASWSELAHEVCKHQETVKNSNEEKLEYQIEKANKELDKDAKNLQDIMANSKTNKVSKDQQHHELVDDHLGESLDEDVDDEEEEDNHGGEEIDDDDDEDSSDYNEDDDDDDNDDDIDAVVKHEGDKKKTTKNEKPHIKDHGVKVDEVVIKKETNDEFLLNKFMLDSEEKFDDGDDGPEEELIIERGRIYFGYDSAFLIQTIVAITCVLILLLTTLKMVLIIRRKRGEQYRMSLLAASKNSFVYQKLTEDLKPKEKELKQPKVHKYAPINQV